MQTRNRLLDDLARVATGALGVAGGLRQEAEGRLRQQFERILADMDIVTREEFEVVQAMAAKARDEQEALAERLAALEGKSPAPVKAKRPPGSSKASSNKANNSKASSGKGPGRAGRKATGKPRKQD